MRLPRLQVPPATADLAITVAGLLFGAIGAAFIYFPAGLIVLGGGLFYLGALHR